MSWCSPNVDQGSTSWLTFARKRAGHEATRTWRSSFWFAKVKRVTQQTRTRAQHLLWAGGGEAEPANVRPVLSRSNGCGTSLPHAIPWKASGVLAPQGSLEKSFLRSKRRGFDSWKRTPRVACSLAHGKRLLYVLPSLLQGKRREQT